VLKSFGLSVKLKIKEKSGNVLIVKLEYTNVLLAKE
jgi:hypothetical protein